MTPEAERASALASLAPNLSEGWRVYVERGYDRRYVIAHVPELLGCISKATTEAEALRALPGAIRGYLDWLREGDEVPPSVDPLRHTVVAAFDAYMVGDYEVNAFFQWDRDAMNRPLVETALRRAERMRGSILALAWSAPGEALDRKPSAGGRTLRETLVHLGQAEWWYMSRLYERPETLPPLPQAPPPGASSGGAGGALLELEAWLAREREMAASVLRDRNVMNSAALRVHGGETWSARKAARRMLEHQWEHLLSLPAEIARLRPAA